MALFRKVFYRKPPDGLLEISEGVYVFNTCFTIQELDRNGYRAYLQGVVGQLHEHLPDASHMVFNFGEDETRQSQIYKILTEYDMTVMDFPRQYEGCPLLRMDMIHQVLKISESWLSLGQKNVLLMHCERGGWPVLAFMLAALLIYRKSYTGEQKTLDMIYKQAPRELLQMLSPLNPMPSQLRYLNYVSRRNVGSEWPPLDRALTLDCIILRMLPNFNGEGGCRPIFRIYGQDPFIASDQTPKVLFSTPKTSKFLQLYKQVDCELVKIDLNCHIQGDVVLECINVRKDLEREEMIFRVVFNTTFIRSNILMLNRDEIDILWDAKDMFPKDFRAEFLLSEMVTTTSSIVTMDLAICEEKEEFPVDAFSRAPEFFSNMSFLEAEGEVSPSNSPQISPLKFSQKNSVFNASTLGSTCHAPEAKLFASPKSPGQRSPDSPPSMRDNFYGSSGDGALSEKIEVSSQTKSNIHKREHTSTASQDISRSSDASTRYSSPPVPISSGLSSSIKVQAPHVPALQNSDTPLRSDITNKVVFSNPPPPLPSLLRLSSSSSLQPSHSLLKPQPPNKQNTCIPSPSPPPPPPPTRSGSTQTSKSSSAPSPPPPPNRPGSTQISKSSSAPSPPPLPSLPGSTQTTKSSLAPSPPPPPSRPGSTQTSKSSSVPPPPPPSIKGRGLLQKNSVSSESPRKTSLKPLHWVKVTRAMQGSLWAESEKHDESHKAPEFDMTELENLFSAAVSCSSGSSEKSSKRPLTGQKAEKVHLVDIRRANNCGIMLTKVKMPLPDLMNSILSLDDSILDIDQVDNLIKSCPTKEEMDLLKGFSGDKESLGKCEQFFLEVMKVPRMESKLRVLSFKIQFCSQVADLRKNLSIVNSVAEEVRNSIKLKRIMQAILSLGNALNQGTARGSAIGFRLDGLLKLTDTRARNNRITLMHYLCKVIAEKTPELLDFSKDLISLDIATKIQLKTLAEEMQAINKGLEKLEYECSASENDGPVSLTFNKNLKDFIAFAAGEVRSLTSLYSAGGRNADALAHYFGEDPARCPFEQVVSTLSNFVRLFIRAHKENLKQIELEKKKAQQEAENNKAKIGSPKTEKENLSRQSLQIRLKCANSKNS